MYPLNDKDLDRLSRDAAEHYDVESSASGWERLENRLDKELPVKKDRRRFLFWLTFVALLAGGSLIFMLSTAPDTNYLASEQAGKVGKVPATELREAENKANENNEQVRSKEDKNGSEADSKADNNTATVQPNKDQQPADRTDAVAKDEPASLSPAEADAVKDQPKTSNNTVDKNKDLSKTNRTVTRDQSRKISAPDKRLAVTTDNVRTKKPVKNKTQKQSADDLVSADQPVIKNDDATNNDLAKPTMPVIDATKMYQEGVVKKDIPAPAAELAKKPEIKQPSTRPPKWEFGLLAGPDFSNVGFKYSYKTGLNLGLTIGYRINNRWQVNTGLIYTKKWYKVDGEDFYPPKHSWISYRDVKMVTGNCSMFEIPVNVRFDFAYNKQSRWFASTGLSSYIMDKQEYECDYMQSGQLYKWSSSIDSNYNYVFSNLNLSVGYERAIGKNFSIQAEPYFRLPLRGLGYGSIDMNSYGLFVTFKYRPTAGAKK